VEASDVVVTVWVVTTDVWETKTLDVTVKVVETVAITNVLVLVVWDVVNVPPDSVRVVVVEVTELRVWVSVSVVVDVPEPVTVEKDRIVWVVVSVVTAVVEKDESVVVATVCVSRVMDVIVVVPKDPVWKQMAP
jgi:hypothetical protein